jgi:hypothetical protein
MGSGQHFRRRNLNLHGAIIRLNANCCPRPADAATIAEDVDELSDHVGGCALRPGSRHHIEDFFASCWCFAVPNFRASNASTRAIRAVRSGAGSGSTGGSAGRAAASAAEISDAAPAEIVSVTFVMQTP